MKLYFPWTKLKKNKNNEYQLYSTPYFDTRSLIRRYSCLQSLSHYNLGQNIVDKLKKESKIGFSMKYFTADFLQLPITVTKGKSQFLSGLWFQSRFTF